MIGEARPLGPIRIHIGFAKAGSTFLQQCLGGREDVLVFPRGFRNHLVASNDLGYDLGNCAAPARAVLEAAGEHGRAVVLSHERLAGNPHGGHYDMIPICERLAALFPGSKVLIVVREQSSVIASIYKQYIRIGGTLKLTDYVEPAWDGRSPRFDWRAYEFHRIVRLYRKTFGEGNVMIGFYEDLVSSPEAFLRKICEFWGLRFVDAAHYGRVNPGIPDRRVEAVRLANFFRKASGQIREPWLISLSGESRLLSAITALVAHGTAHGAMARRGIERRVREVLGNRYGPSNRLLQDLAGRDLAVLGYEL